MDSRVKILAYNNLLSTGIKHEKKELLAVIVEMGPDDGLDVLAAFNDGTVRYINHAEKIIAWEKKDEIAEKIINDIFDKSENIISNIGVWDKPRKPQPVKGVARITFLVSDGLYFGEGPIEILFSDPMAQPVLNKATELMQYLIEKTI